MNKLILTLAFIFVAVGITAVIGSGYFAVNHFVLAGNEILPETKSESSIDPKKDTDKDGISDKEEIEIHGTNPAKADTDADGYNDKIEIDGGYNPLTPPQ